MISARANRDSDPRQFRVDPAPRQSVPRVAMDGNGVPQVVPLTPEVRQQPVLEALVEKFGGEVTYTALTRYLAHQLGWTPGALGPRLIEVLQALHNSGALSQEANGKNDFIVRLLPEGAKLHA